jgi:hypothetical protein
VVGVLGELGQESRRLLLRHKLHYARSRDRSRRAGRGPLSPSQEEGGEGSIDTFGDALWRAVITVTTVGYGDTCPVTPAGWGIAVFLMLAGIALFGALTATVAAFFMERGQEEDPVSERLDEVLRQLGELERRLPACAGEPSATAAERPEPRPSSPQLDRDASAAGG